VSASPESVTLRIKTLDEEEGLDETA